MSTNYSHSTDAFRCDECGQDMAVPLFCDHCGTNYPERRGMGPFAILGLEPRFDLDDAVFEARELSLAQRLHPDLWQSKGDRQHKQAQLAWSAVNEALQTTRDPFSRAAALLDASDEAESGALGDKASLPQAFLIEQLELRDAIEGGMDREAGRALTRTVRHELRELERQLAGHFEVIAATAQAGSAAGEARMAALQGARAAVDKSRYWRNARRALRGDGQG